MTYREDLVNEINSSASAEGISAREAFFELYLQKLEDSDLIEDYHYLYFEGVGKRNRKLQIDGYAFNEFDKKLTLFIIPPLTYYKKKTLTATESNSLFSRASNFYFDADRVLSEAEESSMGYGLAFDIVNKKMDVAIIETIIITDYIKSDRIDVIDSQIVNNVRVDYKIYDITTMQQIDESEQGKEPVVIDLENEFDSKGIPALAASKTKDYESYLCMIPGKILAQMYDKYQSRLLEGNVRSFLQTRGKVNKGIRNTILNDPEMFFAYNNGIAATVQDLILDKTEDGLVIKGFDSLQIVNGGQTTASLASAWVNDTRHGSRKKIEEIQVPMKISVVDHKVGQELIPNISRFANSQNKVSESDLSSNHPFHVKIEEFSRRLVAPATGGAQFGTYWYYERANGQYRQETYKATVSAKKKFNSQYPKNQMFKKTDLAKYWNIYLGKPHSASAGAQKSFSIFSTWMVPKYDKKPEFVNENFFRKTVALAILFKKSDYIVRHQSWYDSYKANIVAYTLSSIIYRVKEEYKDLDIDYNKIWKNQDLSRAWVKQIQTVSKLMYEHLTSPDRLVENVTEWAKRLNSWEIAREIEYDFHEDFITELKARFEVESNRKYAIKQEKEFREMDATVTVVEYGVDFWKEVLDWGNQEKIWNIQDKSFLKVAINMLKKMPSDKQSIKILQVLDKARLESFPK
ncbi:AIPR family protein [Ruoffia tabacinasalis]|uniref:AIPR family protein n=1 Tax=Ruoffia tabacinasalis TaxID=87458 RepID=A0ABS0LI84_9LACT|nr:AIPR family protein [Ruoffia tabacinasalis]MBG9977797.1 AIPR family protein [Ruoffia tabacinasalis]